VYGDRLVREVVGASRANLEAALVLTGDTSAEEAAAAKKPKPLAIAANLRELVIA
jgi:ribonucleotide monophosphatase NagD (HAD superfamily)